MLGQSAYASKLLERSGMSECKPCVTPMERLKLSKASTAAKVDATLYRSIVGGLCYLVHTRLDIAFVVGYVSRFMEDPREDHWAVVKRLLCYVKGMVDQGSSFPRLAGVGCSSLCSAMQTWRGTSTNGGAPLECSSSSGRL